MNGAQWVIDSKGDDLVAQVKEITGENGVGVISDGVGEATFEGSLISFGNANIKLVRSVVFNYIETYSKELFNFIATGKVEVNVHKVYSLKDVGLANSDLEGRHTTGKPVLKG